MYSLDPVVDIEELDLMRDTLPSLPRIMLELYMASTGGDEWNKLYWLIARSGPFYSGLFLLYTAFFNFAIFNILTGMVVENVVTAADRDSEARLLAYRRQ